MLEAEQALLATGFKPNTSGLGLEDIGVELTERKFIKIDDAYSTNIPGIRAVGDVTGKLMLAHVASKQGILCAEAIAGKTIEEDQLRYGPARHLLANRKLLPLVTPKPRHVNWENRSRSANSPSRQMAKRLGLVITPDLPRSSLMKKVSSCSAHTWSVPKYPSCCPN